MKVQVLVITYNCADILPFFLRHYSTFVDEIVAFDDASTDGTRELLKANPKVVLQDWPYPGSGINEDLFMDHWQREYRKAIGKFDWVIIADPDEIVHHPNALASLEQAKDSNIEVIRPVGFNMTGDGIPVDDGRQIWEINPNGIVASVYSKPVIFRPQININWVRGRHYLENCAPPMLEDGDWKLLHYRYLGAAYTAARNARNYARCGLDIGDKGAAWSCAPWHTGEHSAQWAENIKALGSNVLDKK